MSAPEPEPEPGPEHRSAPATGLWTTRRGFLLGSAALALVPGVAEALRPMPRPLPDRARPVFEPGVFAAGVFE